jgi:hypothetical protein
MANRLKLLPPGDKELRTRKGRECGIFNGVRTKHPSLPKLLAQTVPAAAAQAIAYKHSSLTEQAFLHDYVLLRRSKRTMGEERMLRAQQRCKSLTQICPADTHKILYRTANAERLRTVSRGHIAK